MQEVGARMVSSVIAALVIGVLFVSNLDLSEMYLWFGMIAFVSLNSWLIIRNYHRVRPRADLANPRFLATWRFLNLYLSVIWGALWSLAPFLFFPDASLVQIFSVLLMIIILSSTPSVTMGCYPEIYITFLTPVFCSFGYHMVELPMEGWLHKWLVPAAWLSLVVYSLLIFKTQVGAIILRIRLRDAREEADAANLAKTRMLAIASHDLRHAIQAATLYSAELSTIAEPSQVNTIGKIRSVLDQGNRLLDHLLGVTHFESQALAVSPEEVKFSDVQSDLLSVFAAEAQAKQLDLRLELENETIFTDKVLFVQILENLIGNALRYTDEGHVTVRSRRLGDGLEVTVADSGPGFDPDRVSRVFEAYQSFGGHPESRGLGLYIVKRAADALGILITLESVQGEGATFHLMLPRRCKTVTEVVV
jgi:two-component system, sensor histidine kinase|tara:strand:+ start:1814 stop:3073 length:1260 start_codon:yes stop_codon:yes gene_type:complete